MRRQGLILDATMALLTLLVVSALLLGLLAPVLSAALLMVLLIPYVVLVSLRPRHVDRLPLPDNLAHLLAKATSQIHAEEKDHPQKQAIYAGPAHRGRKSLLVTSSSTGRAVMKSHTQ